MIVARISRGARRTGMLLRHHLGRIVDSVRLTAQYQLSASTNFHSAQAAKHRRFQASWMVALYAAASTLVALPAEAASGSLLDEPPLPTRLPLVVVTPDSLIFEPQVNGGFRVANNVLDSAIVTPGKSRAVETEEQQVALAQAETARQEVMRVAEQNRLAILQRQQAEAARIVAQRQQAVKVEAPVIRASREDIAQAIAKWSAAYAISEAFMNQLARCESTFNPNARNLGYYAGGGNPSGLFQFLPQTFSANAKRAGIVNADIWNIDHQAQTTAYMLSIGQARQWECKPTVALR